LQLLLQQKPEWRGEKVVWLPELKADARVRYLSPQAAEAGVFQGARYATIVGVVPDLLAGTCRTEELARADQQVVQHLRQFSPQIRRQSRHLEQGLYLLDASGLGRAFKGYRRWAGELVKSLRKLGWDSRLAVGFTPFATEMATYHLTSQRPIRLFQSREQEEKQTLETSLTAFSLSPEQIGRLGKFGVFTLGDFLLLEPEEVTKRFGGDLWEFYQKASEAIFAAFPVLPEPEPTLAQFGFSHPVDDLAVLLHCLRKLLSELLPRLLEKEEAVAELRVQFVLEEGTDRQQLLRPTYPTADLNWLMSLLQLRLEKHFQRYPLKWGCRVERLLLEVRGEADPERQGDLFTDWAWDAEETGEGWAGRDREAGLWALSQVRAEFGENALVRAELLDHHLPDRDHCWRVEKENLEWLSGWPRQEPKPETPPQDQRIRRILYQPVGLSRREDWQAVYGPYSVNGGWWGEASFSREYSFCQKHEQTAWLYEDLTNGRIRVQGWLQ